METSRPESPKLQQTLWSYTWPMEVSRLKYPYPWVSLEGLVSIEGNTEGKLWLFNSWGLSLNSQISLPI